MHLPARFSALIAAAAALFVCSAVIAPAQSSSSQTPGRTAPTEPAPANGNYVATNPLAGVRYDNRFDM